MAIISLSAPRQGGKDTVGKIIQELTAKFNNKDRLEFIPQEDLYAYGEWKIKKFADKLKEIASLLTGIPKADFEKEEVKNSYLPECWNKWVITYTDKYGKRHEVFFSKFDSADEHFEWLIGIGIGYSIQSPVFQPITVRQFLQWLGTDAIRDGLHENTWVNALMSDYQRVRPIIVDIPKEKFHLSPDPEYPNWIITDTRFPNELQAIKNNGGICIRIDRQSVETGDTHESENAWRNWIMDYVIDNNSTIENLVVEVERMLKHFNYLPK